MKKWLLIGISVFVLFLSICLGQIGGGNYENRFFWRLVYKAYPLIIRTIESMGLHNSRQGFLVGFLSENSKPDLLNNYLLSKGFKPALLAWKDPGEILSLRKLDGPNFQYHIRLFTDGEIRAHYEYSSEGNPWGHTFETVFEKRKSYFKYLLSEFLSTSR